MVYRWKHDLHPWLSLSGGVVLGVALLDLLPEAFAQGALGGMPAVALTGTMLGVILLFHVLDKLLSFHAHHEHVDGEPAEPCDNQGHQNTHAYLRAGSMIFHSLLDGVAIGGGLAIDLRLGLLITLAVVLHDFSDGMSTVTVLKHGLGNRHRAILPFLIVDSLAPFIGANVGSLIKPETWMISLMLAAFAGFFLFLSLSDLLPQAHSGRQSHGRGLLLTMLGVAIVAFIRRFVNV